ncbi:hypothetical protein A3770_16p77940 [Chloropicon primus]|uniref:Uncharacterized protein n=1 Tax=Chloropicon primus TaxID=1764295 RepID=A0A5B8MYZ1_9CHLO|nr:hypothetical protein A3770_16p77940 [Chloropicon primus]|eukprot:QDZ25276.1 hypothetical protein A3770_16p77940 [Chloropicon primus]
MNRLEERTQAAVKVQSAFRMFWTQKRNARRARAAVVIQRRFRLRKEYGAAKRALENARRQRRIRRAEVEAKYLKNLDSDLFENYKKVKRAHAATVIQQAWRRRRRRTGEPSHDGPSLVERAAVSSSASASSSDWESDFQVHAPVQLSQTNCTQYWSLLPQDRRRELLDEIRAMAERASVYDKVYEKGQEENSKRLMQECHESLGRFAALQRAKSRLSKKTALLSNQLVQTQATSRTLDDVATSAQIDYSSLPPLPTGKRLERARKEHELCFETARQADRSRRNMQSQWWKSFGSAGDEGSSGLRNSQRLDGDIDSTLGRRNQIMQEKEARVAQDWARVEHLVELARSYTTRR